MEQYLELLHLEWKGNPFMQIRKFIWVKKNKK